MSHDELLATVARAVELLESDEPAGRSLARDLFAQLIAHDPGEAYFRCGLGRAQLLLGEHDAAERTLTEAIALSPGDHGAYVQRGELRLTRGDSAGARADYERALELMPENASNPDAQKARFFVTAALAMMR